MLVPSTKPNQQYLVSFAQGGGGVALALIPMTLDPTPARIATPTVILSEKISGVPTGNAVALAAGIAALLGGTPAKNLATLLSEYVTAEAL